jgi:hypothetical protein
VEGKIWAKKSSSSSKYSIREFLVEKAMKIEGAGEN